MEVSAALMVGLGLVAALAGFVDAIAGGGGLLTLPALLMAGLPTDLALGTNKGQSVFGSGAALWRFARSPLLNRPRAKQSALPAFAGAALGVLLVRHVPNDVLRPVVLVLLGAVALVLLFRRGPPAGGPPRQRHVGLVVGVAAGLGFYDGFFGPGTGTFLIMAYVTLWHDRMDEASANAKVANFMSNLASMVAFASVGAVVWQLALPMAVGQAVGGRLGAQVTVTRGSPLVRLVVIGVSLALVARLTWQVVTG